MYGDDYKGEDPERYEQLIKAFGCAESKDDLSVVLMMFLTDLSYPRPDIHVAHKRTCIQKGWELS